MKPSSILIRVMLCSLLALPFYSCAYEIDFSTYKSPDSSQSDQKESYIPQEYASKPYEYDEYLFEKAKERYADILKDTTYDLFGEKKPIKHAVDELKFPKKDPLFSQADKDKALYQALALKDSSKLKEALEAGANPNTTIYYLETPLLAALKAWHNSNFTWLDGLIELVIAGGRLDGNNEKIFRKEIDSAFPAEKFDQDAQKRYSFILDLISASQRSGSADRAAQIDLALENLSYSLTPEQQASIDSRNNESPDKTASDEKPDDLYRWEFIEVNKQEPKDSLWNSIKKKIGFEPKEKKIIIQAPLSEEELDEWELLPGKDTSKNDDDLDDWEIIQIDDEMPNAGIL